MPTTTGSFLIFQPLVLILLLAAGCVSHSASDRKATTKVTVKTQSASSASNASTNALQNDFDAVLQKAAAQPSAPLEGAGWKPLYDGHSLAGWQVTDFGAHGPVHCEDGLIVIEMGDALSGINYTNGNLPTMNYEIALDAMKITGSDFFCGLTFPVDGTNCSLILGGWGGTTVGISSIDGADASENETAKYIKFDTGRWYRVRVRVTDGKIVCWLDQEKIIDVKTAGRTIGMRFGEIELSRPLGITTYQTTAAVRGVQIRRIGKEGSSATVN